MYFWDPPETRRRDERPTNPSRVLKTTTRRQFERRRLLCRRFQIPSVELLTQQLTHPRPNLSKLEPLLSGWLTVRLHLQSHQCTANKTIEGQTMTNTAYTGKQQTSPRHDTSHPRITQGGVCVDLRLCCTANPILRSLPSSLGPGLRCVMRELRARTRIARIARNIQKYLTTKRITSGNTDSASTAGP